MTELFSRSRLYISLAHLCRSLRLQCGLFVFQVCPFYLIAGLEHCRYLLNLDRWRVLTL